MVELESKHTGAVKGIGKYRTGGQYLISSPHGGGIISAIACRAQGGHQWRHDYGLFHDLYQIKLSYEAFAPMVGGGGDKARNVYFK